MLQQNMQFRFLNFVQSIAYAYWKATSSALTEKQVKLNTSALLFHFPARDNTDESPISDKLYIIYRLIRFADISWLEIINHLYCRQI